MEDDGDDYDDNEGRSTTKAQGSISSRDSIFLLRQQRQTATTASNFLINQAADDNGATRQLLEAAFGNHLSSTDFLVI